MQDQNSANSSLSKKQKKLTWIFFAVSALVHAPLLWVGLDLDQHFTMREEVDHEKIIKLVLQTNKKSLKDQQIVNNEKRGEEVEPLDSRFLGERHQKVLKETTQKEIGTFKVAGQGTANGSESPVAAAKEPQEASAARKKMAKTTKKEMKRSHEKITFADLAMTETPTPDAMKKRSAQFNQATKGLKNGAQDTVGMGRNNDYIEDVPLGDMTALNTVEFKYFGFYHRIRVQLEQHWGKSLKEQVENLYRTGRRIASGEDKITALRITLDGRGQILDVQVKGSSGVSELDRAAIEAFNRAGPFPNPPQGMLMNGLAEIEWGFVVKS